MSDRDWSTWPAPAKLNLFLRITGRRADGYHELQTLFRLLDWGDSLRLRVREDGWIGRQSDGAPGVAAADDLSVRAAELLQRSFKTSYGIDIVVEKHIPVGGGFGGGSSDAATVLVALNALWGLDRQLDELAELGLSLGADVPVFVLGQNAWAEGLGERLTPVELPPAWYVLVDSGVHAATADLFQVPELTRDAPPATIPDYVSGAVLGNAAALGNAFESVLRRREPAVEAVFAALARIGTPRLTGSGSGCFVEFGDRASADAALALLPSNLRAWVAAGAVRSPLHLALEAMQLQGRRQEAQGTRF